MTEKVALREVGMRDGLQSLAPIITTEQKNAWCAAEFAAGVREIEVTSFVPAKLLPMFADAEDVVRHALSLPGLKVERAYPEPARGGTRRGARRARGRPRALGKRGPQSEQRAPLDAGLHRRPQARDRAARQPGAGAAHQRDRRACDGVRLHHRRRRRREARAQDRRQGAGAQSPTRSMLADTVGYGNPAAIRRVFREVLDMAGSIPVAAHFHNTRGLGLANVLAALEVGVRGFDASLGGLGGCPWAPGATGNIVMEDTAFMLEAMGFDTGIDLDRADRGAAHGRGLHAGHHLPRRPAQGRHPEELRPASRRLTTRRSSDARNVCGGRARHHGARRGLSRAARTRCAASCEHYPGEYWRGLDATSAYPTAFINELTEGGFLSALIPEEYGGTGLPLRAAAVILEEINAAGCTASQGHAQMYIMGTLLRHGSAEQKQKYLPKIASGEIRLQAFGVTEPTTGSDTTKLKTRAERQRRPVRHHRAEGVDVARPLLRHDAASRAHHAAREGRSARRKACRCSSSTSTRRRGQGSGDPPLEGDDQPQRHGGVHGRDGGPGREPHWRGRPRLPLHPRRHERRAHPRRLGVRRRRALVHQQGRRLRQRAPRLRPTRSVRTRACSSRSLVLMRSSRPPTSCAAGRPPFSPPARDCGADANIAKLLASEATWHAAEAAMQTHGGFSYRHRVRHRAQMARVPPVPDRAHLHEHGARLRRPARPRDAAVVLIEAVG